MRVAARGSRPMSASEVIDLPQPDSPTMHSVSPRRDLEASGRARHAACRPAWRCRRRGPRHPARTAPSPAAALEARARPSGDEQVAQAVAAQVDGEDQQRQRACREWRSARTRRTCRPSLRRSSGPRRAAAAARRGPRNDSAASSRIALRRLQGGDDDQVRHHVRQHLAEQDARRARRRRLAPPQRSRASAPAGWRCASPPRSGPTSAGPAPGSRSSSEPPTSATIASATRITGIDRRVVTRKLPPCRSCRRSSRRACPWWCRSGRR